MPAAWRWAAARSIGTSHIRSGLPCQDHFGCLEIDGPAGNVIAAVVSDGAGTASHAQVGAKMVCLGLLTQARDHLEDGGSIDEVDEDLVMDWLDTVRERIATFARRGGLTPRACAATLVGLLAGPRSAVAIHVGDGAAVIREEGSEDWIVPSWPYQGQYASTTNFVTDDPMPAVVVTQLPVRLDRVAIFSDGLERLVLDHASRTAHRPFFDRFTAPVAASTAVGSDRDLSRLLQTYLNGREVCERTDDDKSLILGVRT